MQMNEKEPASCKMKWLYPSSNTITPQDIISQSNKVLDHLLNEKELEREVSEILTLKHPVKRRKTARSDERNNEQKLVEIAEDLLQTLEPNLQNSLLSNNFDCEENFMSIVENIDNEKIDIRKVMKHFSSDTPIYCIEYFLTNNYFSISDLINVADDPTFENLTIKIVRSNPGLCHRILGHLADNHKLKFVRICIKMMEQPPPDVLEIDYMTLSTASDFISTLLLRSNSVDLTEAYTNLLNIYSEDVFQSQILQLSAFLRKLKPENVLDLIRKTFSIHTLNHRYMLILWSAILKENFDGCMSFLSEIFKTSISKQQKYNFTLSLILARSLEVTGVRSYSDSYQVYFGNNSTHITSSKEVEFVLDQFIDLVPYEIGVFLKHHLQLPLRGGAKYKDKLEQYMILAKTRLKDFNIQNIDKNVISDVNKSIVSFSKKNSIPSSIFEASIFKKQYFTSHFLPCLLYDKNIENSDERTRFIDALKAAKKIPNSVLSRNVDLVEVISPAESLQSMIDSLPTTQNTALLGDRIYRQFCVSFNKKLLENLIVVVCEDCANIDAVQFMKPFYDFHKISSQFVDVTRELVFTTSNSDILRLLELFDIQTNQKILKDAITDKKQNVGDFVSLIPVAIESDFLHIIVLGKISSDINVFIPTSVWNQIDVLKLCEILEWWPEPNFNTLHTNVEVIMDNIIEHQPPNSVCVSLFTGCLNYNTLPLTSASMLSVLGLSTFNRLWAYQALATGLLPLYQTADKPVTLIKSIFKRFFNTINILQPKLLYQSGNYQNIDNLCSVLDSYKIYITSEDFVFKYQIVLTILRSISEVDLLTVLCNKSPTFVLSCVYYQSKLGKFTERLQRLQLLRIISSSLKDLDKGLPDQVAVNNQDTVQSYVGMSLFLQSPESSLTCCEGLVKEAYIASLFHDYGSKWINGVLKPAHFNNLGNLFSRNKNIIEKHIVVMNYQTTIIATHFDGYRTSRVFPLLYLGAAAAVCGSAQHGLLDTDSTNLCRKSYQQAQKLVFDRAEVMRCMKVFALAVTRRDVAALSSAGSSLIHSLCT